MRSTRRLRQWWAAIAPGPDVSVLDIGIGVVLSGLGIALVTNVISSPGRHGSVAAALAGRTRNTPGRWRRRYPVGVAAVLGGGAVLNALAIGRIVRCGPALPALMLVAFALGRRDDVRDRKAIALALACLIGSGAVQGFSDPNLQPDIVIPLAPIMVALFGIGRAVSSHSAVLARLRDRNEELGRRRAQTAELAAQADRARIAAGLDDTLRHRIADMALAAEAGQAAQRVDATSFEARVAFASIERTGRDTLRQMRHVVGALLDDQPPIRPLPDLSQLEQLVTRASSAVLLQVEGRRRALPAGLELSAYRTVEYLLEAFGTRAGEQIAITLEFGDDVLTVVVRGPAPAVAEQRAALAASQARVALHDGALSSSTTEGHWEATARLPLPVYA